MQISNPPKQVIRRSIAVASMTTIYLFTLLFPFNSVYAASVPGGNIQDPVVRAVNIAKPAVVRIITGLDANLTVYFSDTEQATFPRSGGNYHIDLLGSGAFISSNGDILTASHVINPPHDASLDLALFQAAAQDVADYINNNFDPILTWTEDDAYIALANKQFLSTPKYQDPKSKVYRSTDYTGPLDATDLANVPQKVVADVTEVKKESSFDQKDIAIIHVDLEDTPSIQLGDASSVSQQDELTIIGYPGNGDVSEKNDPTMMLTASVNKIYVSALKTTDAGAKVIQVGGNVEHGDSGGPALDREGHIVGVVSFGLNGSMPEGTAFLQSSDSVHELLQDLDLDLKPGKFQTMWVQAYADYASTKPGHWQKAQRSFKNLQTAYPDFRAIGPYVTYINKQADAEKAEAQQNTSQPDNSLLLLIGLGVVVILIIGVGAIVISRRRKKVEFVNHYPGLQPQPGLAPYPTNSMIYPTETNNRPIHEEATMRTGQAFGSTTIPNTPQPAPAQYEQVIQEQARGQQLASPAPYPAIQPQPGTPAPAPRPSAPQPVVQPQSEGSSQPSAPQPAVLQPVGPQQSGTPVPAPQLVAQQQSVRPVSAQQPSAPQPVAYHQPAPAPRPSAPQPAVQPQPAQPVLQGAGRPTQPDSELPWPPPPTSTPPRQPASQPYQATPWQKDDTDRRIRAVAPASEQTVGSTYTPPARPRPQDSAPTPVMPVWQTMAPVPTPPSTPRPQTGPQTSGNGTSQQSKPVAETTPGERTLIRPDDE